MHDGRRRSTARGARAALALWLALVAAGCHKDAVTTCRDGCTKTITCLGGTQGQILDCQNSCDKRSGDNNNCSNANDVLDCQDGCYAKDRSCNDVVSCLGGCPKCVK